LMDLLISRSLNRSKIIHLVANAAQCPIATDQSTMVLRTDKNREGANFIKQKV